MKGITGTFIDEITWDIPPQNWSFEDWRRDIDAMQAIGIDTLIIIRGGLRDRCTFPSKVVGWNQDYDLAGFFFEETARRGMKLFFGTYDSASSSGGHEIRWREEFALNKPFIEEVLARYGHFESFYGWYVTQEFGAIRPGARELFLAIGGLCKELTPDKKILISPFYPSRLLYPKDPVVPAQFREDWLRTLRGLRVVDYCAFQDGTAPLSELEAYVAAAHSACEEAGIILWNNVETFSRDFPIKFPPQDFRIIKEKLRITDPYVAKHITFEFSHFMSPNSVYPAAANLYKRYREAFCEGSRLS
jgi:hypothetical protein